MDVLSIVALAYLLTGIIVLVVFDFLTKRVRKNILPAVAETQLKVAGAGALMGRVTASYVGRKTAIVFTLLAMWLFWPVVLYGYVESKLKRRDDADKI